MPHVLIIFSFSPRRAKPDRLIPFPPNCMLGNSVQVFFGVQRAKEGSEDDDGGDGEKRARPVLFIQSSMSTS